MTALAFALVGITLIASAMYELHERREERIERLNRESWEVLRTTRRIHDETTKALQALFEEARTSTSSLESRREIDE